MPDQDIVIVAAKRTPIGSMSGSLSSVTAPELCAITHNAVLQQANIDPNIIDEIIIGCVLQAGIGQAPARQAAIIAGITYNAGATTINKMCGSGLQAVIFAIELLKSSTAHIVIAGGMENMSRAPYLLLHARNGYRLGHDVITDHMFIDGLEDAYEHGKLMGCFAEDTATYFNFSREEQDEFAQESLMRAIDAINTNKFSNEIVPVKIINHKNVEILVSCDESPDINKLEKIKKLKPAFQDNGTITAANSSSIADGAASILMMNALHAKNMGILPLARIVAYAKHAQEPRWFTTAPIFAIQKVLKLADWCIADVDLFEINEAFAVVTMAAIKELKLNYKLVNIHGGACALGHPIGASGARILVTLIYALQQYKKHRGIATLCIGGGEALAIAIELI